MEIEIGALLTEKKLTIACAESCSGGLLTDRLTNISGSSAYVKGAVVAYANEIKINILHVNEETLKNFGAVSSQTAKEMAENVNIYLLAMEKAALFGEDLAEIGDEVNTRNATQMNTYAEMAKQAGVSTEEFIEQVRAKMPEVGNNWLAATAAVSEYYDAVKSLSGLKYGGTIDNAAYGLVSEKYQGSFQQIGEGEDARYMFIGSEREALEIEAESVDTLDEKVALLQKIGVSEQEINNSDE